jgi:hypothetical protein
MQCVGRMQRSNVSKRVVYITNTEAESGNVCAIVQYSLTAEAFISSAMLRALKAIMRDNIMTKRVNKILGERRR